MIIKGPRVTTAPTAIFFANTLKSAIRIERSVTVRPDVAIDSYAGAYRYCSQRLGECLWVGFFTLVKASAELAQNKSDSLPLDRATTTNKRRNVRQPGGLHGVQLGSP
jgi:hypothetical protein